MLSLPNSWGDTMPSGGFATRIRRRRRFRNKKRLANINKKIIATGGLPFKTLTQYKRQKQQSAPTIVHAPEAPSVVS